MSKHTPGPWTCRVLNSDDTVAVIRAGTLQIAAIGYAPGFAEEANARLIAAAPDLLAALRELLAAERFSARAPETVQQAEAKLDRIRTAVALAEAAIAKAEGKQ